MLASIRAFLWRVAHLGRRSRSEASFQSELDFHLQMETDANLRLGMSLEEARRRALIAIGGLEQRKEEHRDGLNFLFIENFFKDVRFAWRTVLHEPRFTVLLVLVLALGIGCATAMFSVLDRLLVHPLPFPESDRLVVVNGGRPDAMHDYRYWGEQNQALESAGEFNSGGVTVSKGEVSERVAAACFSPTLFSVLGTRPALGREFTREEATVGRNRVAVISDAFWSRYFARDRAALGGDVNLNGIPHAVVGIMPRGFDFPAPTEVWVPCVPGFGNTLEMGEAPISRAAREGGRIDVGWMMIGRLRPGMTVVQAQAQQLILHLRLDEWERARGRTAGSVYTVRRVEDAVTRGRREPLLALFAAVGCVLLIACANAANLLLVRSLVRRKEIAVRLCLGAPRSRILRLFLFESGLLALLACLAGVLFAGGVVQAVHVIGTRYLATLGHVTVNPRVLLFSLCLAVCTSLFMGLVPALSSCATDMNQAIKQQGSRSSGRLAKRARGALVVTQVALAVILLTCAGLMLRSLARLLSTDPGFQPANVLTAKVSLPKSKYSQPARVAGVCAELLAAARRVPGVTAAAFGPLPMDSRFGGWFMDRRVGSPPRELFAGLNMISPDYFKAMGIPLLGGRTFTETDASSPAKVMVVNQTLARMGWPDRNAIGEQVRLHGSGENAPRQIVGIVRDIKTQDLTEKAQPQMYLPYELGSGWGAGGSGTGLFLNLVLRVSGDARGVPASLRANILAIDRDLPPFQVRTMGDLLSQSTAAPRFRAWVLLGFGAAALLLAAFGVYGVVSYSVVARTHELGVRISLGAPRHAIISMVVREGVLLAVAGAAVGLLAAFGLNRLIASLLFGVRPDDGVTFSAATLLLLLATILASLIPALRACKVDPIVALRHE